ncbi:MAG: hypothetical protein JNM76_10430 [Betaproteobacteria bacterium]|nr:hypothetical protein [Betaproteobacteria bacterium]
MQALFDVLPYWVILTGLYVTVVFGGGAEWIKARDSGPFSDVPVWVWKRVWHLIWVLGSLASGLHIFLSWLGS